MPVMMRTAVLIVMSLWLGAASVAAQSQPAAPAAQLPDAAARPITGGELQKLFDAFALQQAQDALQLSDAQYGPFATRLKALQDTRRKHVQARNKILGD